MRKAKGTRGPAKPRAPGRFIVSEGEPLRRVIVCPPRLEYHLVDDLAAHNIEAAADSARARAQHSALRAALRRAGAAVISLRELRGHPNSVFTRDACLVTPRGYVKLRMGLPTRRGEEDWLARAAKRAGLPAAGAIEAPGTVEGGDVILAGRVAFVGLSGRTNESGLSQLSGLLGRMGYEVRSLRLPPGRLHIGGEMSLAGPDTVICYGDLFPPGFFEGFEEIEIAESTGSSPNIMALGRRRVIAAKGNEAAIRALERSGFKVTALDLSEFIKGRGGPTCLIMPVERGE